MNRRTQREAGDVASWALGVTAGLVLGVTLLIATPQLMKAPQAAEPAQTETNAVNQTEPTTMGATTTPEPAADAAPDTAATDTATTDTAAPDTAAPDTAATDTAATDTAAADAGATGDAAAGQTVFAGNCAACHGANGQGQIGPSLVTADGPKAWTDAQFLTSLREGKTPQRELSVAMPRFAEGQISDADVANIHAYIKTLN
ncbi:c-type cytochrome [Deinococcus knuensis]|nr:cytochrome c [Deinococcus knuensis]